MPEAVLGIGGNLGARRAIFRTAIALLDAQPECRVLARSQLYATPPLGPPQPDYLNAAVRVRFDGDVEQLFALAQRIEGWLGRERRERWGARTVDLDLLHWSEGPVHSATLDVPHRELKARAFALAPLLDVAPELSESLGETLRTLGGAPSLAQPSWPELVREGVAICGSWLREDAELASQLVELLAASPEVTEHADQAVARRAALTPHAFTGPRALFDADDRSWLTAAVADALARGFIVQMAAVLGSDETQTYGVLLGYDGGRPAQLGPDEVVLERAESAGPDPERRVKMPQGVSERGFDFNSSGTI